ncbi:DUF6470 family protein [Halobacillus salinarum]|uniref:DUF6470 family protein n=1 Tax=Halobacillus salinarum TaxID=2932257 RepID=A0ABY4EMQ1_9BACI|nr:DUF6470 family protein [Halobacillus salinarum]UOQ45728.1 DUF6470 family protein [Halobacillus salinarum]
MEMPRLQVETTPARLGIMTHNARQTIRQPDAELSIQQPKARLLIEQRPGKLTIDQTRAWQNIDLKSIFVRSDEMVSDARQLWLEGIARAAQEGDELMRIEHKGNPIATQAEENSRYQFELDPGGLPAYDLVDIHYAPSEAEINVEPQKPVIEAQPRKPELGYQRGNVDLHMEQYPDVKIDWKV